MPFRNLSLGQTLRYQICCSLIVLSLFRCVLCKPIEVSSSSSSSLSSSLSSINSDQSVTTQSSYLSYSSSSEVTQTTDSSTGQSGHNAEEFRIISEFKARLLSQLHLTHLLESPSLSTSTGNRSHDFSTTTNASSSDRMGNHRVQNLSLEIRRIIEQQILSPDDQEDEFTNKIDIIKLTKQQQCRTPSRLRRLCYSLVLPAELVDASGTTGSLSRMRTASLVLPTRFPDNWEAQLDQSKPIASPPRDDAAQQSSTPVVALEGDRLTVRLDNRLTRDTELDMTRPLRRLLRERAMRRWSEILTRGEDRRQQIRPVSASVELDLVLPEDEIRDLSIVDSWLDTENIIVELNIRQEPVLNRRKRSQTNYCNPSQYFCCTQRLEVTLEELKLDPYIVAPMRFVLNYCSGDCNNFKLTSNHARGLNQVRNHNRVSNTLKRRMRPCCVPYSYSSLDVMYIKENNDAEFQTIHNIMADTCGCM